MEYKIKQVKMVEFLDSIKELEKLLTERISDLHEVKGYVQARHAYVFYRKKLWESKDIIVNNCKEIHKK